MRLGKYVVLFFYPKDFTFVCPTEIIAFSDRAEEFRKINTELIACSCDRFLKIVRLSICFHPIRMAGGGVSAFIIAPIWRDKTEGKENNKAIHID